ncbi:MAG: ATP-binding protein [Nanoarchaeota archaeon]|nr:ATP-binding protein [Nanoarchaeota archaeon]MBU1030678.1 ATP-binding protein [Nanoarchaeota archaeon]MBU1849337.1 ATP-binding protein [Nanoarchaeota archaeon]
MNKIVITENESKQSLLESKVYFQYKREKNDELEKLIGNYFAIRNSFINNNIYKTGEYFKDQEFCDIHALNIAAKESQIKGCSENTSFGMLEIKVFDYDLEARKNIILGKLLEKYYTSTKVSEEEGYFENWLLNETEKLAFKEEYQKQRKISENIEIRIEDRIYKSLKEKNLIYLGDTKTEFLVGNTELEKTLRLTVENLMFYNPENKKNLMLEYGGFPQTMMIWGRPGTGKTTAINNMIVYAKNISAKIEKPLEIINISNNFKSEYFSKSANELRKIFSEISKGEKIYITICEDIDTVFFSRNELKSHPEEKKILGEVMNILEGITTVNKGNNVFIATTNNPLSEDSALANRLNETIIKSTGPKTADDYILIFQNKLKAGINQGFVKIKDWINIGVIAKEYDFNGRDIKNICKRTMQEAKNFEKQSSFYKMDESEFKKIVLSFFKDINEQKLITFINNYQGQLLEQKRIAKKTALEEKVDEIKLYKQAQIEVETCLDGNQTL